MSVWKRKWTFWMASGGCFAVLGPLTVGGVVTLARLLGSRPEYVLLPIAVTVTTAATVSIYAGSWVCRRMGVSPDRTAAQTLVAAGTPSRHASRARLDGVLLPAYGTAVAVMALAVAGFWLCIKSSAMPQTQGVVLLFPLVTLGFLRWLRTARLTIEADDDGLMQQSETKQWQKRIPWSEIGSCTVETTTPEVLGLPDRKSCVFRDREGKQLLRMPLWAVSPEDSERFLNAVQEHLGLQPAPAELIAADTPAGTGLEPEAAAAPAGRGTEVEAARPEGGVTEAGRAQAALKGRRRAR